MYVYILFFFYFCHRSLRSTLFPYTTLFRSSEIAASYGVNYLPIIRSARAFSALWKRAYSKAAEWLAAVVYEDPWLAGGHKDRKSTRLNSSHVRISYAVFCLKKKRHT